MTRGQWVYVGARGGGGKLSVAEKLVITAECEKLIASVLIPQFLPEIRPTEFNYPIAIYGKWHGNKYRFITRFRSDHPTLPSASTPWTWKTDLAMSRPIVVIVCMLGSSKLWGCLLYTSPSPRDRTRS